MYTKRKVNYFALSLLCECNNDTDNNHLKSICCCSLIVIPSKLCFSISRLFPSSPSSSWLVCHPFPLPLFCLCSPSISLTNILTSHSSFSQRQHSIYFWCFSPSVPTVPHPSSFVVFSIPTLLFLSLHPYVALLNLTPIVLFFHMISSTCYLLHISEMYQFSVSEGAAVGTPVGRVIAMDADMGENTDMSYLVKEGGELFKVTTDVETQEAVVSIKKVQLTKRNSALLSLSLRPILIWNLRQKFIQIHKVWL